MLLQEAQECQPKKKKNPLGKLVQREVSSKKPRAAYFLAGHDADSNVRDRIVDEMLPEIANINQRSTIAANMMRANIMALTCEEEEESSPVNNDMFPATPFHLPYCQPVQNEGGEGMVLWHQVIESSHHQSLSSAKDEGVSNAYKTEEFILTIFWEKMINFNFD